MLALSFRSCIIKTMEEEKLQKDKELIEKFGQEWADENVVSTMLIKGGTYKVKLKNGTTVNYTDL